MLTDGLRQQFLGNVAVLAVHMPLIQALYAVLDNITEAYFRDHNQSHVCGKGCGLCCHQIVYCLPQEWEPIRQTILGMQGSQRFSLTRRMRTSFRSWQKYQASHVVRSREERGILKLRKDWLGQKCPFLNQNNECDVYDCRPISCRGVFETEKRCESVTEAMNVVVFPWSKWAFDILLADLGDVDKAIPIPIHALVGYPEMGTSDLYEYLKPVFLGK